MNYLTKSIKRILIAVMILSGMTASVAASSPSSTQLISKNDYLVDGDSFIPIPWGKEAPISWILLSGSWMLRQGTTPTSYFTFKVINQNGTNKVLQILQIEPKTCTIMGSGVGSLSTSKVIYATLRNSQNREVYRLNLRNFAASSFVKKVPASYEGTVVMMSVAPISSYAFTHFSMARVNPNTIPNATCRARLQ
ncbi:MAG: hypothetical protein JNL11_18325 [Bdellovibrionaceae bacterium]|nr:hypothetical protein [Pseudobdellovibrionaceae bacterium]